MATKDESGSEGTLFGEKRTDESWKEKARREKERLAEAEEKGKVEAAELPPASFGALLEEQVLRAMVGLGQLVDPASGQPAGVDLGVAKYAIDMLGVLEAKTRGNLDPDEARALGETLHSLRLAFVHVSRAAAGRPAPPAGGAAEGLGERGGRDAGSQDAGRGGAGSAGAGAGGESAPPKPRIIL